MPPRLDRFRIALVSALQRLLRCQPQLRRQFSYRRYTKSNGELPLNQRGHQRPRPQSEVQAILTRIRPSLWLYQLPLQVPDELTMRPPNCSAIPSGASLDIGVLWLARTLLISSDTRSAVSLESKLLNPPTRPSAS